MESSSESPGPGSALPEAMQERMKGGRYQFTEEEKRALQECRFESFWYRSLPLAAAAGASTHMLVQRGLLNPSRRFGSYLKVMFASVCGYIIGKMLYMQECRKKFMKLENSPFAEMVRRGRGGMPGGFGGMQVPGYGDDVAVESEMAGDTNLQHDTPWSGGYDQRPNMDIDTSKVKGIDNTFDSDIRHDESDEKPDMTMTYDELRKQSREKNIQQYTQDLPGHYQPKQSSSSAPRQDPDQQSARQQQTSRGPPRDEFQLGSRNRSRMVNQYGDTWEKE